jgi:hypothetical protein
MASLMAVGIYMSKCTSCLRVVSAVSKYCRYCGSAIEIDSSDTFRRTTDTRREITSSLGKLSLTTSNRIGSLDRQQFQQTLFILPPSLSENFGTWLKENSLKVASVVESNDDSTLELVRRELNSKPVGSIKNICILGAWNDVSPVRLYQPVVGDPDQFCLSDAPYGCLNEFNEDDIFSVIPEIPVGRIPSSDIDIIFSLLCAQSVAERPVGSFQFAVSADCWRDATHAIVESFSNNPTIVPNKNENFSSKGLSNSAVLTSPGWSEIDLREATRGRLEEKLGLLLFNVHGSGDSPEWVGEGAPGDYVKIFEPGTISDYNSANLVAEACYGGAMWYEEQSIVEHFFEHGGRSFVGSSMIAYGCSGPELSAADVLARDYIAALNRGLSYGESLTQAKLGVLNDIHPAELEVAHKTILSFNLCGVPWHGAQVRGSPSVSTEGSVLDRIREGRIGASFTTSNIVQIRDEYRRRLPFALRSFLERSEEMMQELRNFRDFSTIESAVAGRGGQIRDARMDCITDQDREETWRIFCPIGHKQKGLMIFFLSQQGQLKKTLISKGMP